MRKINISLLISLGLLAGTLFAAVPFSPHAFAAVDQKYVKTCKTALEAKTCNNLKQAWIDSCQHVYNQPVKQNWIACIAAKAKVQGSTDADKIDSTPTGAGLPNTQDPATNFSNGTCKSATDCNLVKSYVNPFINKFLAPLAILAVIFGIIWGAIDVITSAGDPQRSAAGKDHIRSALIGLVTFMFLYALLNWLIPGGLL